MCRRTGRTFQRDTIASNENDLYGSNSYSRSGARFAYRAATQGKLIQPTEADKKFQLAQVVASEFNQCVDTAARILNSLFLSSSRQQQMTISRIYEKWSTQLAEIMQKRLVLKKYPLVRWDQFVYGLDRYSEELKRSLPRTRPITDSQLTYISKVACISWQKFNAATFPLASYLTSRKYRFQSHVYILAQELSHGIPGILPKVDWLAGVMPTDEYIQTTHFEPGAHMKAVVDFKQALQTLQRIDPPAILELSRISIL